MEVIRIGPEELRLRKSLRALAGLLPSEEIRDILRLPPMERQKRLAEWARRLTEKHIETQTALTRKLKEGVREATEKMRRRKYATMEVMTMHEALERARTRRGGIIAPEVIEAVVIQMPAAIRRELNALQRVMERYARMPIPAAIQAEIRIFRKAAEDLRDRIARIRGLAGQLGIDPNLPEIAMPLQQAEFMARDFEERVRRREQYLQERGQIVTG